MPAPSVYDVDLFAGFNDLQLVGDTAQCIAHTVYDDRRRCRLKRKADAAQRTRKSMLDAESLNSFEGEQNFRQYVLSCLCGVHQKSLAGSEIVDQIVQRWGEELRNSETSTGRQMRGPDTPGSGDVDSRNCISGEAVANHRYSLRRRETRQFELPDPTGGPPQGSCRTFWPHSKRSKMDIGTLFQTPLQPKLRDTGFLYILTRSGDSGFLKIGRTKRTVELRSAEWGRCGREMTISHVIADVPYVWRAESLIHLDSRLRENRRYDTSCLNKPCGTLHKEWYEIELGTAITVLNEWASFLKQEKPYDANGLLTEVWMARTESIMGDVTLDKLSGTHRRHLTEAALHGKVTSTSPQPHEVRYPVLPPLEDASLDHTPIYNTSISPGSASVDLEARWRRFTSNSNSLLMNPWRLSPQNTTDFGVVPATGSPCEPITTNGSESLLFSTDTCYPKNLQRAGHALLIFFSIEATAHGVSLLHRVLLAVSFCLLTVWGSYVKV